MIDKKHRDNLPPLLESQISATKAIQYRSRFYSRNPFAAQAKMLWHLDRLAEWKLKGDTFPVQMEINLTNYCNEACRWCISSYSHIFNPSMTKAEREQRTVHLHQIPTLSNHPERRRGIDIACLQSFLEQAKAKGLLAVTWSGGGEPTTHPNFVEAVEYAANLGLEQGLMTNGLYPESYVPVMGKNLRWMRVSLDTINAEKYEYQKFTKGFRRVISNIEQVIRYPVKVGINMNLAAWNVDEVLAMAKWCRDTGVDYFQIRPILGLPFDMEHNAPYRKQPELDWIQHVKPLLHEAEKFSTDKFQVIVSWDKFEDLCDVEGNFGRVYKNCMYHFFFCVLNADGDLCVCMYHLGDKRFSFGNIYENTVEEIWNSAQRRKVIDMCANHLDLSTCQVCCKGHEINKLMHFIENPNSEVYINFL